MWLPPRRAPFGRRAGQPSEGAPTRTARSPRASKRRTSPFAAAGRRVHDSRPQQEPEHRVLRSFPPSGTCAMARQRERSCGSWRRRRAVRSFGQTGTDRIGWYACPRRTLFATEWSAARKNPMRAAALHFSAAISADVKARRILTSGRRKFPSGNFRSARDLEVAKRVRRGQAYRRTSTVPRLPERPYGTPPPPHPSGPSPFARNRGMSPLKKRPHRAAVFGSSNRISVTDNRSRPDPAPP